MSVVTGFIKCSERLLPLTLMTLLCGKLGNARLGRLTRALIKAFVRCYRIQLDECVQPDPAAYATFNEFFARAVKPESHPLSTACIAVCPCDGTVAEAGEIVNGRLIQAKGIDYSLRVLLGGDQRDYAPFEGGGFATVYLAPSDYHRVHMPLNGNLLKTVHIPGRLFPVGKRNLIAMPNLYTRNERLVCLFETEIGLFAVIMVAAALVGNIEVAWADQPGHTRRLTPTYFDPGQVTFTSGQEIGRFKYGSTVICLWPESAGTVCPQITPGRRVRYGQALLH